MLNWIFKSTAEPLDLSFLQVDLHSHLLPGIDDGVKTVDEAVDMIRTLHGFGYQHLITTPHIIWDAYRNTPEIILQKLAEVREACQKAGLNIRLDAAAEYFLDEHFTELLTSGQPLLTLHENRILVELPYTTPLLNISETLFQILKHGYRPILAHPERYVYFHHQREIYSQLSAQGCELQLNALSLTGYYGDEVAHMAEWLLKENLIVYLGTDAHRMQHLELLKKIKKSKWLNSYPFQNHTFLTA
jgi:protein-tyrosine phosphatase